MLELLLIIVTVIDDISDRLVIDDIVEDFVKDYQAVVVTDTLTDALDFLLLLWSTDFGIEKHSCYRIVLELGVFIFKGSFRDW
jgi:hypothetical protein